MDYLQQALGKPKSGMDPSDSKRTLLATSFCEHGGGSGAAGECVTRGACGTKHTTVENTALAWEALHGDGAKAGR